MAAELIAGLSAIKTAFDIAKGLKDIDDATRRNAAVIELQKEILAAQEAQFTLVSRVRELEEKVRGFEKWDAEKGRYELKELRAGTFAYTLKPDAHPPEPAHSICPDCYQEGIKRMLTSVDRFPGRCHVVLCQHCGWEVYVSGGWHSEHGATKSASRRTR